MKLTKTLGAQTCGLLLNSTQLQLAISVEIKLSLLLYFEPENKYLSN
jgi:hypothetical protein